MSYDEEYTAYVSARLEWLRRVAYPKRKGSVSAAPAVLAERGTGRPIWAAANSAANGAGSRTGGRRARLDSVAYEPGEAGQDF
ncbi:hypothetical protein Ssi02_51030 [Sinosporangium siamense]|uniref:Uncharacterized protein n=1 Tax=Sinosporangium siamense TaxID=1367973 RepID=A0A919RKE8_9ACTN|nr:hypothetical protein Ssi02_51030 [Sinosporangium siamense]